MKYTFILFWCFIAASQQLILLQPSIQLQHFHARLAGGRDLRAVYHITLWLGRFHSRVAFCVFYKIKLWRELEWMITMRC